MAAVILTISRFRARPAAPDLVAAPVATGPLLAPEDQVHATYGGSESCRECHEVAYKGWMSSNHALAEREYSSGMDEKAFAPKQTLVHGKDTSETFLDADGTAKILTLGRDNQRQIYPVVRIIGNDPLRQFLVPAPGGRLQTCDVSYDPKKTSSLMSMARRNATPATGATGPARA